MRIVIGFQVSVVVGVVNDGSGELCTQCYESCSKAVLSVTMSCTEERMRERERERERERLSF